MRSLVRASQLNRAAKPDSSSSSNDVVRAKTGIGSTQFCNATAANERRCHLAFGTLGIRLEFDRGLDSYTFLSPAFVACLAVPKSSCVVVPKSGIQSECIFTLLNVAFEVGVFNILHFFCLRPWKSRSISVYPSTLRANFTNLTLERTL